MGFSKGKEEDNSNSFFKASKDPFDNFDFNHFDRLFAENELLAEVGKGKIGRDGKEIQTIRDFFQENYFPVQIDAFLWGLDTIPDELNFTWLYHLHSLAILNLKYEERGTLIRNAVRQQKSRLGFPDSINQMIYGAQDKASPDGIDSLNNELIDELDNETKGNVIFLLTSGSDNFANNKDQKCLVIDAKEASEYYKLQKQLFELERDNIKKFCNIYSNIDRTKTIAQGRKTFELIFKKEAVADFDEDLANKMMECLPLLRMSVGYKLLNANPFQIREKAERLLKNYNDSNKINDEEKLDAIITLIKGLLNLHVWPDGNGRLCAFHLLNILLKKNGFSKLAFLENGALDAFTKDELKARIKNGMLAFSKVCTQAGSSLVAFRKENGYILSKESEFSKAILQNNLEHAKKIVTENPDKLTEKDTQYLASCSGFDFDWFLNLFDKALDDNFFEKMFKLALDNANSNLLISLINYLVKEDKFYILLDKEIERLPTEEENELGIVPKEKIIFLILMNCNYKIFSALYPCLIAQLSSDASSGINKFNKKLANILPFCKEEHVSTKLLLSMDNFFKKLFLEDYDIIGESHRITENFFKFQTPLVVNQFIESGFIDKCPVSIIKQLVKLIKERDDLTLEQKNSIIKPLQLKFSTIDITPYTSPDISPLLGQLSELLSNEVATKNLAK